MQDPLEDLFRNFCPEAVYHLAAYAAEGLSHHIPLFNQANNVLATVNVLNATYRACARHFVFTSSVARCIAEAPFTKGAEQATFNVGGDDPMTVRDLAQLVADLFETPLDIEWLPARKEVTHANCRHERVARAFPHVMETQISIAEGLKRMADFVQTRPLPQPTECPASIEIPQRLPASWARRLCATP